MRPSTTTANKDASGPQLSVNCGNPNQHHSSFSMGASFTKVLPFLTLTVAGDHTKPKVLKKENIECIATANYAVSTSGENCINFELLPGVNSRTVENLKNAAYFIHNARASQRKIVVIMSPQNTDSAVLICAYFLLLTGLPVKIAKHAVTKLMDKLEITENYDISLERLHSIYDPQTLREELLASVSSHDSDMLTADVKKIYQLAELSPPTLDEINLESLREFNGVSERQTNSTESVNQDSKGLLINYLQRRLSRDIPRKDSIEELREINKPLNSRSVTPDTTDIEDEQLVKAPTESATTLLSTGTHQPVPANNTDELKMPPNINIFPPDDMDDKVLHLNGFAQENGINIVVGSDEEEKVDINDKEPDEEVIAIRPKILNSQSPLETRTTAKVKIYRALSRKSVDYSKVDEYFDNTTAEQREKIKPRVKLYYALAK